MEADMRDEHSISEIPAEFRCFGGNYKRKQVDAVICNKSIKFLLFLRLVLKGLIWKRLRKYPSENQSN